MATKDLTDLIPIKGISYAKKRALASQCKVYDIAGLLASGATPEQRKQMAERLETDVKYVTNWVMQADLWRLPDMSIDLAYILTLAGIRSALDLMYVDLQKLYPVLLPLYAAHPDLSMVGLDKLGEIIEASQSMFAPISFWEVIEAARQFSETGPIGPNADPEVLRKAREIARNRVEVGTTPMQYRYRVVFGPSDPPEPTHLYEDGLRGRPLPDIKTDTQIISEGLTALQDIAVALPLPRTLSGQIRIRYSGEADSKARPKSDVLIQIDGITNPSEQKLEDDKKLSCFSDGDGRFLIVLPDKYNVQEKVTFTITQGMKKQTFVRMSSELLERIRIPGRKSSSGKVLYTNELISKFYDLDTINKEMIRLEQILETYQLLKERKVINDDGKVIKGSSPSVYEEQFITRFCQSVEQMENTRREHKAQKVKRDTLIKEIYDIDPTTDDIGKTLTNLLSRTDLDAEVGDLILTHELFNGGWDDDKPRVLPSVKLMGEGDDAIRLPTDTAPSRTYRYTMLQRLVEPAIYPAATRNASRAKLMSPVDVMGYKKKMAESPDSIPQAATLGIGYVLNMHQAWVPDGFALGTLLYSTILAPGEEQRLVVREQSQSYSVADRAEGQDRVWDRYLGSQVDSASAAYDYAMGQEMEGESSSQFSTTSKSFGFGLAGAYQGISGSLSFGYSNSRGRASSSSRQSNSSSEASQAAQSFQHRIRSAAERVAEARRVSIRAASSNESSSVSTRIIANHNHSHAMTIQYWEVMRRYRLETCIDGVDLVLFVPMKLIRFLPAGQSLYLDTTSSPFRKAVFDTRYDTLVRYYDSLYHQLPYRYRTGLNLIQRYASYPEWVMEKRGNSCAGKSIVMTLTGKFLEVDSIVARLRFSGGKGSVQGQVISSSVNQHALAEAIEEHTIRSKKDLLVRLKELRASCPDSQITLSFTLPKGVTEQDFSEISIRNEVSPLKYKLYAGYSIIWKDGVDTLAYGDDSWTGYQITAVNNYLKCHMNLYKDENKIAKDYRDIAHYRSGLPENFYVNQIQGGATLDASSIRSLTPLYLTSCEVRGMDGLVIEGAVLPSYTLQHGSVYIDLSPSTPILRYSELQSMETTLQHIASETLRYSQGVWSRLSDGELAIMLESYTVDMNFKNIFGNDAYNELKGNIDIPLLNCINVHKMLGFYGNCMIFPFTYPQSLAEKLGKTAAEIQDALYRYHASSFRVPVTTISLPTEGLVGEAVLGETNVSEEIDLTRFWNWKDSEHDKMELSASALSSTDYLQDKAPGGFASLGVTGPSAPTAVTTPDLITPMTQKQTPTFTDITGTASTSALMSATGVANIQAQSNALTQNSSVINKALDYCIAKVKGEAKDSNPTPPETPKSEGGQQSSGSAGGGTSTAKPTLPPKPSEGKVESQPTPPPSKGDASKDTTRPSKDHAPSGDKPSGGAGQGHKPEDKPQPNKPGEGRVEPNKPTPDSPSEDHSAPDTPREDHPSPDRPGEDKPADGGTDPEAPNPLDLRVLYPYYAQDVDLSELGFVPTSRRQEVGLKAAFFFAIAAEREELKDYREYKRLHETYPGKENIAISLGLYLAYHDVSHQELDDIYLSMVQRRVMAIETDPQLRGKANPTPVLSYLADEGALETARYRFPTFIEEIDISELGFGEATEKEMLELKTGFFHAIAEQYKTVKGFREYKRLVKAHTPYILCASYGIYLAQSGLSDTEVREVHLPHILEQVLWLKEERKRKSAK